MHGQSDASCQDVVHRDGADLCCHCTDADDVDLREKAKVQMFRIPVQAGIDVFSLGICF